MSRTGLAHSKSSTHGRVLALIPQAFPEQHCWARPTLGAGRQRNSTLNGQAVPPTPAKWGDSLINNDTEQGDVIAKRRQQHVCVADHVQCRPWDGTMFQSRGSGLERSPHRGEAICRVKGLASNHTAMQPSLSFFT